MYLTQSVASLPPSSYRESVSSTRQFLSLAFCFLPCSACIRLLCDLVCQALLRFALGYHPVHKNQVCFYINSTMKINSTVTPYRKKYFLLETTRHKLLLQIRDYIIFIFIPLLQNFVPRFFYFTK